MTLWSTQSFLECSEDTEESRGGKQLMLMFMWWVMDRIKPAAERLRYMSYYVMHISVMSLCATDGQTLTYLTKKLKLFRFRIHRTPSLYNVTFHLMIWGYNIQTFYKISTVHMSQSQNQALWSVQHSSLTQFSIDKAYTNTHTNQTSHSHSLNNHLTVFLFPWSLSRWGVCLQPVDDTMSDFVLAMFEHSHILLIKFVSIIKY